MSNPINVNVPQSVVTAAKAVAATATTAVGVVTLFVTQVSDGVYTWDEGGTLIGAVVTAAATIGAVWKTRNKVKG